MLTTHPLRVIGAFAPSSSYLADAMTKFVPHLDDKSRILEVGAGTGAITKVLIKKMHSSQTSDVVELIPQFASLLKRRFQKRSEVSIFCSDLLHFESKNHSYDLIVSSLPFNALKPGTTSALIDRLVDLAKDGAILSFFEYKMLHPIACHFVSKKHVEQYRESSALIEKFLCKYKFDEEKVYINFPPAVVHYLRINKTNGRDVKSDGG